MTTSTSQGPRLVFGDDGSAGADLAWLWINAQRWPGWHVDVVSVTPPAPTIESLFTHEPLHEFDPGPRRAAAESAELASLRFLTTAADPPLVLSEEAKGDVIVVGARGRGLLKAMHLGSTAEWLLHYPFTPVVIVRDPRPIHRVLVCCDGSGHARAAVRALMSMPWIADASVEVLAVVEAHANVDAQAQETGALLRSCAASVEINIVRPDELAVTVNPRLTIFERIHETNPDLVTLGTRGLSGMPRLFVGSVASAVVHHAPCTVLVAREHSEDESM